MKRALIFGGGVYGSEFPEIVQGDFIIAADAGTEILKKYGIEPDIAVGDFDSSSFIPEKNVIKLPVEKDITDSHAAVNIALDMGFEEIVIYGGMGGRPDHSFANYTLVALLAQKGIKGKCIGEGYTVTAVKDGSLIVDLPKDKTVSVFSWSERATGVTLKGLKYTLEDAELLSTFALGVSNSTVDESAEITVKDGTLLIMYEN